MEIVDVVNSQDEVVDQKPRRQCHEEGLLHRGSTIIVYRTERREQLLLQKRSEDKTRKPGRLCFTGGHLEAGDSYRDGARREFFEELYSRKTGEVKLEELAKFRKSADDDHEIMKIFSAVDDGPFEPQQEEVQELVFMRKQKLLDLIEDYPERFTKTTLKIVENLEDRI